MYYVLTHALLTYRNYIIAGELVEPQSAETFYFLQNHWWDPAPLPPHHPPLYMYLKKGLKQYPDTFKLGGGLLDGYSERLCHILQQFGVQFELVKTVFIDKKSKETFELSHQAFHLQEMQRAIDLERSVVLPNYYDLEKWVLTEECLQNQWPMFRVYGFPAKILVHEKLKSELEREKITGFQFMPVEQYQCMMRGLPINEGPTQLSNLYKEYGLLPQHILELKYG